VLRVVHLSTVHALRDPRIFEKQVKSLQEAGFDVQLVVQHDRSEVVDGIAVTALTPVRGRYRRVGLLGEAYRKAHALKADLYHFHDPELIPVGWALQRHTGARIVYDMHEDYRWHGPVEGRLLRTLERWCFSWIDHVVLASDSYATILNGTKTPFTVIHNYFKPMAPLPEGPRTRTTEAFELVYTGVQSTVRGLMMMLELARQVQEAGLPWRLSLPGVCYRADDRAEAEQFIARHGLAPTVQREGWDTYLPWQHIARHYERAHVGLALVQPHPNYMQGYLTKFFEYLHYGLPILCSDFPGWRAFVEQHGCGAVVPPDDPQAALRVLRTWYDDPALYARLSEAALRAAPRYRWDVVAERLVALYQSLLT
jgi:glycosyltransferase involved in cell wall biosynthesis